MGPERIVSLVPSLTELLFDFGLDGRVVGRTRFCVEPAGSVERVAVVGGTKNPRIEKIVALKPDLVLANREENRREDVEAILAAGVPVRVTDPASVPEALRMISELGELLGCAERASAIKADVEAEFGKPRADARPRVFVAVWHEPLMGLGDGTYGHDLVERAGGLNVLRGRPRYPEVELDEVAELKPDLVILPDEPFPFDERQAAAFEQVAPVRLIDGKLLWWYGPRMAGAICALREIMGKVRDHDETRSGDPIAGGRRPEREDARSQADGH